MKDEELFAAIRGHIRDERKDDDVLERIARGEDAPEGFDASLAAAARPLGPEAEARIAAKIAPASRVVPFRRRASLVLVPLALAAAVLLGVGVTSRGGPDLPGYAITATGEQAMRGPSDATSRLHLRGAPDARFSVVARPATPVTSRVSAHAFALRSAYVTPLDASVEVAEEGSIRITGAARALEGASEIRVVVGASDADAALARAKSGTSDRRVAVLTVAIDRE
jgi:hypothetical protein